MSKREAPVAIISIPQQASAKLAGHAALVGAGLGLGRLVGREQAGQERQDDRNGDADGDVGGERGGRGKRQRGPAGSLWGRPRDEDRPEWPLRAGRRRSGEKQPNR